MIIQIQLLKNKSARLQSPTLRIQWNLEKNSLVLVKSVISFHELEKKAFVSPLYPREQLQFEKNGSLGAIHCKIDRETLLLVKVSERERIIYFHTTSRRASNFCSPFSSNPLEASPFYRPSLL